MSTPREQGTGDGPDALPNRLRDRLLTVSQLGQLPAVRPLVDGLLYRGTVAQLSGPPGCYKTFIAIGMAVSVALGEPFEDHHVAHAGPVVYVAPEGASGLRARILAWCELTKLDPPRLDDRLFVLPAAVQLGNPMDIVDVEEIVTELGASLLVLDTRARCTLGLEENSATEQGRAIAAVERIAETGCTVLGLHHSARNGTAGRGSNAWDGGVWSDLRISGENLSATLTCHKHKDVPAGCDHSFRLVPHTVSEELMPGCAERQRQTLVAVRSEGREDHRPDTRSGRIVRDIVRTCAGPLGLTRAEIRDMAAEQKVSRSQAYEAINVLVKQGILINLSAGKIERLGFSTATRNVGEVV